MKEERRKMYCRAQELCESRGGRPGLPAPYLLRTVSVDVKQHRRIRKMFEVTVLHNYWKLKETIAAHLNAEIILQR